MAGLATHLHYHEPSNYVLVSFLQRGLFHALCQPGKDGKNTNHGASDAYSASRFTDCGDRRKIDKPGEGGGEDPPPRFPNSHILVSFFSGSFERLYPARPYYNLIQVAMKRNWNQVSHWCAIFSFTVTGKFSEDVMRKMVLVLSHLFGRRFLHASFKRRIHLCPTSKVSLPFLGRILTD